MAVVAVVPAEEPQPFGLSQPSFSAWSPLDTLPIFFTEYQGYTRRSETPLFTGNRGAATEWGKTIIAAGPSISENSPSTSDSATLVLAPSVFGGFAGKHLFGGLSAAAGAAFFEPGKPGLFFATDAVVEYIKGDDDGAGLGGRATLAGGLAGPRPFPWALSAKALAGDTTTDARAEIIVEAATPPAQWSHIGQYRLAAAAGFSLSSQSIYSSALIFRSTFEFEGREYFGGLAKGLAAQAAAEASWSLETGSIDCAATASMAGGYRFGDRAGILGRLGIRYNGYTNNDWEGSLRLLEAAASLSGDLGLLSSIELPLLFARGRLFMQEDADVRFFLKPYFEIILLRPAGSELFIANNLHSDAGMELAMLIDADRNDVLRAGAGFDLSSWMQGSSSFPGSSDLGLYMIFSIAI